MHKTILISERVRGTGNILQDLISSTIILSRVKLSSCSPETHLGQLDSALSLETQDTCGICASKPCQLLTLKEIGILQELISSHPLASSVTSICSSCSRVLKNVTKLKRKIEISSQVLKSLVTIQHKKQQGKPHDRYSRNCVTTSSCIFCFSY